MRSVACTDRLKFLRPALAGFLTNLDAYAKALNWEDLPHAYNERATLSVFAAACWQARLIALEEYVNWKGWGDKVARGRADLWARCPRTDNAIVIEAKQQKTALGAHEKTIKAPLRAAVKAAKRNYDAKLRGAMTFFTPVVRIDTERDAVVELFERICATVLTHGVDALALWYPEEAMLTPARQRELGHEYMFPGVIAALRIVAITGEAAPDNAERLPVDRRFRSLQRA